MSLKRVKIMIDAGHGGSDPGAIGLKDTQEKDITLKASEWLKKKLSPAITYMTREKDIYLELQERAEMANQESVDYFISVHCNAWRESSAKGFDVMHSRNSSEKSRLLAEKIANDVGDEITRYEGGVRARNYVVLTDTKMPAILIELGFLTNPGDYEFIMNDTKMHKLLDEIASSILDFIWDSENGC